MIEPRTETGAELASRLRRQWSLLELAAVVFGAFVVLIFLHRLHSAADPSHTSAAAIRRALELVAYLAVAIPIGVVWRERRIRYLWAWLREDRAPVAPERQLSSRSLSASWSCRRRCGPEQSCSSER